MQSITNTVTSTFVASMLIVNGFAQAPAPAADPGNSIMGFETPKGWVVKSTSALTRVSSSTKRTQGSAAFALTSPSSTTTMTGFPVPSTASALTGVGNTGASFALDILPPADDTGSLKLSVSSPSRGLKSELVGEVSLKGLQAGIYTTVKFPIPSAIRSALADATYSDLSFEFTLSSTPANVLSAPQFLFDNLRVVVAASSGPLLSSKLTSNFGGSVTLSASGDATTKQSFAIGAVQVPEIFRLLQGTANGTTVTLALGHDTKPAFTCTYDPDDKDPNGASYRLSSCTDGMKAGDLAGANYAELTIVGGTDVMKLYAQLARNPVGDVVGRNALPPMPTFWGHFDTCVPEPVPGKVYTVSPSCASQHAENNRIVTDYFKTVLASKTQPDVLYIPLSEDAVHHGTGQATDGGTVTTTNTADFPFDKEGHLNQGGDFDAYWRLKGDINTRNDSSTGNNATHFDTEFSGHVVLFGGDANVASVNATVDTTSGSTLSATGSAHLYLFGIEVPGGGSVDASAPFNFNPSASEDYDLLNVTWWVFQLEVKASASVSLQTTGTLTPVGFNLTVEPKASMGMHVVGSAVVDVDGINIAQGGLDARIDLLDVSVPITAQAGVAPDISASHCSVTLNYSLDAELVISTLGGEIDATASVGPCPACWQGKKTLLKWDPVAQTKHTLFKVGPTVLAAFPLPVSFCTMPLTARITSPATSAQTGIVYPLTAAITSQNAGTVGCLGRTWSVTPAETISGSGCGATIQFSNPGPHTITLNAVDNITDQFGRIISETGLAGATVIVTSSTPGAYITGITPASTTQAPFNNKTLTYTLHPSQAVFGLTGEFVGSSAVTFTWTATNSAGQTVTLPGTPSGSNQSNATWTVPGTGVYTVKMTAADSIGKTLGSAVMTVKITFLGI